jgi:hypothetical protein
MVTKTKKKITHTSIAYIPASLQHTVPLLPSICEENPIYASFSHHGCETCGSDRYILGPMYIGSDERVLTLVQTKEY